MIRAKYSMGFAEPSNVNGLFDKWVRQTDDV